MPSVAIHQPKTPVTAGSMGIAKATLPNVCKMPGPPAPFVPSPLPNIAKSGSSPSGYSTTVEIEGNAVAIRGATFESMGDMASKGTGGGLISANTHGPAKFITPGSLTVKIEGKSVHLLAEPMLNNCGPNGSPPNTGATMVGLDQYDKAASAEEKALQDIMCKCHRETPVLENDDCKSLGEAKHQCCDDQIKASGRSDIGGERGYDGNGNPTGQTRDAMRAAGTLEGTSWPDACAMSGGNPTQFFDFKFICPDGVSYYDRKSGTVKFSRGGGTADSDFYFPKNRSQFDKYRKLGKKTKPKVTKPPRPITSRNCASSA